ncbi:MAG: hypothetical protein V5A23_01020 [Halobacteriales archaeon]
MALATGPVLMGLPEFLPDLIGAAGAFLLVLMLVAIAGFVYRTMTGSVEWPDEEEDEDALTSGDADDEWDYY